MNKHAALRGEGGRGCMWRVLFSFCFWVLTARWIYSEIAVAFPEAIPTIDSALQTVDIPTHDKWDKQEIKGTLNSIGNAVSEATADWSFPELFEVEEMLEKRAMLPQREPGYETF